jgi:hypothetical protein
MVWSSIFLLLVFFTWSSLAEMTYYDTLELQKDASLTDIKKA